MAPAVNVVILGGGTAGWMTAAALSRLLDPQAYSFTLVESDAIGTVGVGEATLPHIKQFNDLLGIDEAAFMRATRATFKLGIEFRGWGAESYIHPFGTFGESWGGLEFQHHWTRARLNGLDVAPFQAYSFAVAASLANRFAFPDEDQASIRSSYAYAYHFDAGLYAAFLRERAERQGVRRVEGEVAEVKLNPQSGQVESLLLKSGAVVRGDIFIDCSGFRAVLLGAVNAPWEDWTPWLPCDRALAVPSARAADFSPYTRSTAQTAGWTWRIPLQHRTGNGYVYASAFTSDDQAHDTLMQAIDGRPAAEPRLLRFAAGRRTVSWSRNVIGIGLASGFLEPLESTSIYLIQQAVIALAELMPKAHPDPRLTAEFNRRVGAEYDRVRDFLILHYHANSRHGEPLWDHCRAMAIPDSLAHKIELFRGRGYVPVYRDGLFARDSWLSVLMGQGIAPHGYDRLADGIDLARLGERFAELKIRIDSRVTDMPAHDAFIARYCGIEEVVS